MSRIAKRPLNPAAVAAANEALAEKTGGRPLTMSPEDAELRAEWMDHYLAAGGETEEEDWGEADAWFFSA
jgi:hypothetical protein